jgi:hypothetical protein
MSKCKFYFEMEGVSISVDNIELGLDLYWESDLINM